jgi:hypothetical protein
MFSFGREQVYMDPAVKSVMHRYCVTEERNEEFQIAEYLELSRLDSIANIARLSLYAARSAVGLISV